MFKKDKKMRQPRNLPTLAATMIFIAIVSLPSFAQHNRILGAIDDSQTVTLKGNMHPSSQLQNDKGLVESDYKLSNITLSFRASAKQQADLKQLLADQQDPSSPSYHKWLTPQEYADRFGLSQSDVNKIVVWLKSHGFTVEKIANGRNWVRFSGSAQQVTATFHTEIHRYDVNGETHIANASEPSVPKAIAGMVIGIRGLDDFRPHPSSMLQKVIPNTSFLLQLHPEYSSGGSNYLAPDDIATIYNVAPLLNATPTAYDGTGQTIGIVGQSQVNLTDISAFRTLFGQTAVTPQVVTVAPDPGFTSAEIEGDLDLEWVGAVARNAALVYDVAMSAFTAADDVIDNNRSQVLSISYSLCEAQATLAGSQQFQSEVQKGNTMGITTLASSGDAGAAGCDDQNSESFANQGLAVNIPASIPEVTAVGGTTFSEGTGSYWGANGAHSGSALSYIPEVTWNDGALGTNKSGGLWGSGGGVSTFFPKPSWQTGTGVPADGFRDVPDVAMNSSAAHDGYLLCASGGCPGSLSVVGGTSASTPVFAGLVAILSQYSVANGIQATSGMGRINDRLYQLAQSNPTTFHDVTTGTNIVQCTNGTPNCTAPSDSFGYTAGVGYDQVTGLGSVDANALMTNFNPLVATTTTLAASATSITIGTSVTFTATVTPASGTTIPTGTVTFSNGGTTLGTGTLNGSGVATLATTALPAGNDSVTASYAGDSTFTGSTSSAVSVTVAQGTTTTTVSASAAQVALGASITFTAKVLQAAGSIVPTGTVTFTDNANALGSSPLTNGTATLSTSSLAAGVYSITATYNGDTNYLVSSGSTPATIVDFTITANPTSISVSPGSTGTTNLTLTPNPVTFNPSVSVTCSGAPSEATCSVNPSSTTVNGSTVAVSLNTTAPHVLKNHTARSQGSGPIYAMFLPLLGIVGLARKRKQARRTLGWLGLIVVLAMSTLWLSSCGGGGGSSGPSDPGTPAGSYNLTVTVATSSGTSISKNITIPLTVQ
jgi:subtilase family serine protease